MMNIRLSTFIVMFFLILLPFLSVAQIPNAGFEQWTLGEPDGWQTSNVQGVAIPITRSATSHSDSFALRGEVVFAFFPPIVQSGQRGKGFAVSQRYTRVTGFYQFYPVAGDQFVVNVTMFRNGKGIAVGGIAIPDEASSYTPFTVDLNYLSGEVPDTCIIKITIIGPMAGGDCHPGSTMLVDDLSFSGIVSVPENKNVPSKIPEWFELYQNYPNPFNPKTIISYSLPKDSNVKIIVYNTLGQVVNVLVDQYKLKGYHSVAWIANGLPSGVYLYSMEIPGYTATKKMFLKK